ncbi:hypothetical protein SHKM778_42350 [Streptomyces sp. KM77-8]|uniref:DUF397 domain-containing protein n=1 Tax=Streptomyces haneummycinicus TaxID=3074435 RepID=A0AAT9HKA1_9ACTN
MEVSAPVQSARRAMHARAASRSAGSPVCRARSHNSPVQKPPVQEPRAVVLHVPVSGSAWRKTFAYLSAADGDSVEDGVERRGGPVK